MKIVRIVSLFPVLLPSLLAPGLAWSQSRSVEIRLTALENAVAALQAANNSLNAQVQGQAGTIAALQAALAQQVADSKVYADNAAANALAAAKTYSDGKLAPVADKLVHFSRNGSEVYITGANLNIRNGLNASGTVNALGNLVLGYNELRTGTGVVNARTGSHNLVLGFGSNYTSWGGHVGGGYNTLSAPVATVLGGTGNTASGNYAVVGGGYNNLAIGNWSHIGGGQNKIVIPELGNDP